MDIEKSLVLVATNLKDYSDQQKAQLQSKIDEAFADIELVRALASKTSEKLLTAEEVKSALLEDASFVSSVVGEKGDAGPAGQDGTSVTVEEAITMLIADQEFLESVKGAEGPAGEQGIPGEKGLDGAPGVQGEKGEAVSAEELIAVLKANEEFLQAVKGDKGDQGPQGSEGLQGLQGERGDSVTVDEVTKALLENETFTKSLVGATGPQGEAGIQGEKGDNGNSVTVDEVKSALVLDIEFVKSLIGPKGEEGTSGPVGPQGEQGVQGEVGPEGLSIKSFEITESGELTIEMSDGQTVDLGMIKGAPGVDGQDGESFDLDTFYEKFKCDNELIESLKVDPTEIQKTIDEFLHSTAELVTVQVSTVLEHAQAEFAEKMSNVDSTLEDFNNELEFSKNKSLEAGLQVAQEVADATTEVVTQKMSEIDQVIESVQNKSLQLNEAIENVNRSKVQQWTPDTVIKAGSWVEHDGRYYVANRDSDSVPGNSTAYSLVLRGFEFRKAWSADTNYERLDVVISSSGSAWIANKSSPNGEPGTTPDWNLLVKRGERGAKGDMGPTGLQGEKGLDASEILDVVYDYESEEMTFIKSDGSRISFDLPVLSMIQDLVTKQWIERLDQFELPINDFRGLWNSNTTYQRGDVVTFTNGVSIAKQTVSGVAPMEFLSADSMKQSGDSWQLMMAIAPPLTGGTGGSGGTGEQGPMGPRGPKGDTGPAGPTGATGPQGPAGTNGKDGALGPAGPQGPTGADSTVPGPAGADGKDGAVGPKGDTGDTGPAGADGAQGPAGVDGKDGLRGPAGADGAEGPMGPKGDTGDTGSAGADGAEGPQGIQGPKGDLGATGDVGPKGDIGNTGPQGEVGPVGPAGSQGDVGPAGPKGDVGPKGDQGDQGIPGLGITFKGRLATVGDLPATAAQGDMYIIDATGDAWVWDDGAAAFENAGPIVGPTGPQGEVGAEGAVGPTGPQGPAGPTAVSADVDNTAVLGTDGLLYVGKPTGYLPTTGGDMTGPINVKGNGAVAFQFDNGFNFQAVSASSALRFGTKSVLGFNENEVVATVPFRTIFAPTLPEHVVSKKYVDDAITASGGGGVSGLPTTGGTMTGTIVAPIATPMSFMNTYSLYSQNGGVSFRFGATDLIAFSSTGIYGYKPFITPASGIGIQFGNGGGYLSKVGVGIGVYAGGVQRMTISDTVANFLVPVTLGVAPTSANHAATKSYVDDAVANAGGSSGATIVSIADGATEPAAADYPEGALLVRYTP